jgi:hypothetical protein
MFAYSPAQLATQLAKAADDSGGAYRCPHGYGENWTDCPDCDPAEGLSDPALREQAEADNEADNATAKQVAKSSSGMVVHLGGIGKVVFRSS